MVGEGRGIYIQLISGVVQVPQKTLHNKPEWIGRRPGENRNDKRRNNQVETDTSGQSHQAHLLPGNSGEELAVAFIDYERGSLLLYGVKPVFEGMSLARSDRSTPTVSHRKDIDSAGVFCFVLLWHVFVPDTNV